MMRAVFLAVALVAFVPSSAEAASPAALIDKAGIDAAFTAIEQSFELAAEATDDGLPAEVRGAWADAAREFRIAERLRAEMSAGLEAALAPEQVEAIADFYDSPLGRRIVGYERDALDAAAAERITTEGARLREAMRGSPVRWAEHQAVIDNSGSVDLGLEIARNVMVAMVLGMDAASGAPTTRSFEEIEALVADEITAMRPGYVAEVERAIAYTYRDLSLSELRDYNAFLASSSGAAFYAETLRTLTHALTAEVYDFGGRLARALDAKDI